jgi:nucleotide-binding universal stress UspA family protein
MNTITLSPEANQTTEIHLGTSPIVVKEILAATDFSAEATLAVKVAARLTHQFACKLHVLHAVTPQVYLSGAIPVMQELDRENAQQRFHAYTASIPELRITKHDEILLQEPAPDAIAAVAEQNKVDLVVVGSSGRDGFDKLVLGSVAEAAIRHVRCPVLIVGPNCLIRHGAPKAIVLATSLHVSSLRATQYAVSVAREFDAALTLLHVLPKNIAEQDIFREEESALARLRELVPSESETSKQLRFEVTTGARAEEVVQVASRGNAGLIVMGVREHGMLADHAPWATLSEVIRTAHCPVLAVQSHLE